MRIGCRARTRISRICNTGLAKTSAGSQLGPQESSATGHGLALFDTDGPRRQWLRSRCRARHSHGRRTDDCTRCAAYSDLAWPVKKGIPTVRRNTSLGWISFRRTLPPIHGRVTPHSKCPTHRVAFLRCRASPLNNDLSGEGSARSHD